MKPDTRWKLKFQNGEKRVKLISNHHQKQIKLSDVFYFGRTWDNLEKSTKGKEEAILENTIQEKLLD